MWHKQYDNDVQKADMTFYPRFLPSVGMFAEIENALDDNEDPPDYPPDGGDCPEEVWWLYKPFHYHCNKIGDMSFDPDNDDNNCPLISTCGSESTENNCLPFVDNLDNLELLEGFCEYHVENQDEAPEAPR